MMQADNWITTEELNQIVALMDIFNDEDDNTFNSIGIEIALSDSNGEDLGVLKRDRGSGTMVYWPNAGVTHYE